MVEIIVTIALEVAKCLAPSAGRQISYLREHKTNFNNLKAEVAKLKQKHMSIQHRVDEAERNGEVIEDFVQTWLERAAKIIDEEAAKFTEDEETAAKKRCLKGLCPDLKIRHQLCKQAVKQLDDLARILKEADSFGTISYRIPPMDPRLSIKNYESFKSRMPTLKNVISSLSNPDVHMVGIYGMGGIGKTTIAKEVAKEAERKKLFDRVVFAEVSHSPNINKIQGEIADTLGLTLSNKETDSGRAGKLSQGLKNEKKILIILDNIWGHLDLQEIGIPVGEEHKGCKVLLTSRSFDVLARQLDCQQNFSVEVLNDEEAWSLFKEMNGDKHLNNEGSEFKSTAIEVARRCGGLPIAIVTVARALRKKELFEWKNALLKLRMSSSENIEGIHAKIELSYHHLKNEVLKKTILLIGYASITSIDDLLMCAMSLDLFGGINNMEERRDQVRTLVQQLKDSCLLFDSNTTGGDFSMHDVVRDATISIASRYGHVFRSDPSNEWEWPDENRLNGYSSIVRKDVKTGQLPSVLECHQLKLFSISATLSDSAASEVHFAAFKIHNSFFTTMPNLKVLVLANMELLSLPSSLSFLKNLRALGLYNCNLGDIVIIGDLKKLEILSFQNSYIWKLPMEIGLLNALKSLDLRHCSGLKVIPPNVISSLSHLEELYMGEFCRWEEERTDKDRKNASLDELKLLTKLTCLEIIITNARTLPKDLSFKNLERYKIEIKPNFWERDWSWESKRSCRKFKLSLSNTNICLHNGDIMQLKGIEDLCLDGLRDTKSILYGLDRDGFPRLKYLEVIDNSNLLCIVDSNDCLTGTAFPLLESLDLKFLPSLEKICSGQVTAESFSQLRMINMRRCDKLENIFSLSIARRLQQLHSINVFGCDNMKVIFAIEREDESNNNIELSQLRSLTLYSLPKLRSFCSTSQQRRDKIIPNALFSGKIVLPSLEFMELSFLELVDIIWGNQVVATSYGFQNLTKLIIHYCENLRRLSSSSVASSLVQLQHLEIQDCDELEEIVVINERKDVVFPQLQFLRMARLKNLTKFCSSDWIEFPSLKELKIQECPKLKEFLARNNTSTHLTEIPLRCFDKVVLPKLETLIISECDEVESLFGGGNMDHLVHLELKACEKLVNLVAADKGDEAKDNEIVFGELKVLRLSSLQSLTSISFVNCTLKFPSLVELSVDYCPKMKSLLTSSIAKSLGRLREMKILECCMITEIVAADKGDQAKDYEIVFSELEALGLSSLNSLTNICSANCTLKFPSLVELYVDYCPKMKSFLTSSTAKSLERLRNMLILGCHMITEIVAVDKGDEAKDYEFDFGELKVLHLSMLLSLTSFYSTNCTPKFPSLVELYVSNCPQMKSILTSSTAKSLGRLTEMSILDCHMITEIVAADKGDEANDYEIVFSELKELHLYNLESLTRFCFANCTLKFPSLVSLSLYYCHKMKSILTSSTAKSLVQLVGMIIEKCDMLTEIVAVDKGDERQDNEIIFSELNLLKLSNLQSVTNFCSATCTLKFPSLEDLIVDICPNMKSFSKGELSTPRFRQVSRSLGQAGCWKDDLNTTMQQLHEGMKVQSFKKDSGQSSNVETSEEDSGQPSKVESSKEDSSPTF